jgi:hypothetical protein
LSNESTKHYKYKESVKESVGLLIYEILRVLTAVSMSILFCVVTPCELVGGYQSFGGTYSPTFSPEDGGSMFLRNVGLYIKDHMELQLRGPM